MNTVDQKAYALRCLLHLTSAGEQGLSVAEIARIEGISVGLAAKILNALKSADLVNCRRGVNDTYQLGRDLDHVTLADLTAALERLTGGNGKL